MPIGASLQQSQYKDELNMTKFTGKLQTLAINSGTSGTNFCLTSVDYSLDINMLAAECAGGANVTWTAGMQQSTATLNWYVDSQAIDDILGSSGTFVRGDTFADYVHNPEGSGSGNPTITSTNATIGASTLGVPANGFVAGTTTVHFDDLTFAALA